MTRVPREVGEHLPGRRFPDLDGLVPASAGDARSVGAEGHAGYRIHVPREAGEHLPGRRVPDLDGVVKGLRPLAMRNPWGLKATLLTENACPERLASIFPVWASQTLTVRSRLPLAIRDPSRPNATLVTELVCPVKLMGSLRTLGSSTAARMSRQGRSHPLLPASSATPRSGAARPGGRQSSEDLRGAGLEGLQVDLERPIEGGRQVARTSRIWFSRASCSPRMAVTCGLRSANLPRASFSRRSIPGAFLVSSIPCTASCATCTPVSTMTGES